MPGLNLIAPDCHLRSLQLHRVLAKAALEGRGIDFFQLYLTRQNFLLPVLVLWFGSLKFRHHFFGKEFKALANVFVAVLTRLVQ